MISQLILIGLEQIRYISNDDLSLKLEKLVKNLFDIWRKRGEFILALKPLLEIYLNEVELTMQTKKLIDNSLQGSILGFTTVGAHAFVIIDKGSDNGIKKNMIFDIYQCDQVFGTQRIEENVGQALIYHVQATISLALPISHDPLNDFWKNALSKTSPPMNIARPHINDLFLRMTDDDLISTAKILRVIIRNISV